MKALPGRPQQPSRRSPGLSPREARTELDRRHLSGPPRAAHPPLHVLTPNGKTRRPAARKCGVRCASLGLRLVRRCSSSRPLLAKPPPSSRGHEVRSLFRGAPVGFSHPRAAAPAAILRSGSVRVEQVRAAAILDRGEEARARQPSCLGAEEPLEPLEAGAAQGGGTARLQRQPCRRPAGTLSRAALGGSGRASVFSLAFLSR